MLGRRERKREQTKQGLLKAAIDLFTERGYNPTTIDDIVAAADVAKVTFYYYFKSKEDIVLEIKKQTSEEVLSRAQRMLGEQALAREILHALLVDVVRWMQENARLLEVFIAQRFSPMMKGELQCDHDDDTPPMVLMLEQIILHGQSTGEFRKDIHPKEVGYFVALAIMNEQFVWIREGRKSVGLMARMDRCFDLILNGIARSSV